MWACLTKHQKPIWECPNQSNTRMKPAASTNTTNRLERSTAIQKIDQRLVEKNPKIDARVLQLIKYSTEASCPHKYQKSTWVSHSSPTNGLEPGWRNTQDQWKGAHITQLLNFSLSTLQKNQQRTVKNMQQIEFGVTPKFHKIDLYLVAATTKQSRVSKNLRWNKYLFGYKNHSFVITKYSFGIHNYSLFWMRFLRNTWKFRPFLQNRQKIDLRQAQQTPKIDVRVSK